MFKLPDFLDYGREISKHIDNFFDWFRKIFSIFFTFLKNIFDSSLTFINDIFNNTPWWIWLILVVVYVVFTYIIKNKNKLKAIILTSILVLWLIIYNVIIKNPSIDVNITNAQTPWWIFIGLLYFVAYKLHNHKTAAILSVLLLGIGVLGAWEAMLSTLSIIILAIIISFVVGLPVGILMAKSKTTEKVLKPILDMMQTIPTFVYLIPAVMLFGIGKVPATFATTIYAIPPLVRLTALGIQNVDKEMVEAGNSFGSTPAQMLFKIELPQAISSIATGLNQTTMMAVAMVVTASMIGAGGLGQIVLDATNKNQIGNGFVGGFAIVFLAIILDRLLSGIANKYEKQEVEE